MSVYKPTLMIFVKIHSVAKYNGKYHNVVNRTDEAVPLVITTQSALTMALWATRLYLLSANEIIWSLIIKGHVTAVKCLLLFDEPS